MKKVFILLIVVFFTMCKQKPQTDGAIFVDLDRPEKVSLFDYFRSIELIPLETSNDVLLVGVKKMLIHQDNYYILDPKQSIIFVFDKFGRFKSKIDNKGQGKGEYSMIQDFTINPFSSNLEVLEAYGKVHVYDLLGNYIETKTITFPGFRVVHTIAAIDAQTHVFHTMFEPEKIIYFNLDEQKLLHQEFKENSRLGSFSNNPYQYRGDWFFFRPVHPIVYQMGSRKLEAAFRFDFGTYTREGKTAVFSKESERSLSKCVEELFDQFPYLIHSVRHNSKYVFASLSRIDLDDKVNVIYDRASRKSKYISEFTEKVQFNSYRGEEIIVTDEYVLMPCQWVDLEKRITKEMLDDNQKEIFEELLKSEMEENPILIKYWFK
ncbi:6-bladed beta-propeller [Petrimonas sulfuriphila]|uniref:6-bladed beta-propeller n=1 Tax=Petrimonas TaxID=307628 RepID=UPI000E829B29|nr:6-bladed beta-propeller [Petrimonas sp.]HBU44334.1 6-bladed beta-propeller [Porphyromonadaceae bacterium]